MQLAPYDQRNLAADPHYAALLAALRGKLASWRAAQGDAVTGP